MSSEKMSEEEAMAWAWCLGGCRFPINHTDIANKIFDIQELPPGASPIYPLDFLKDSSYDIGEGDSNERRKR